MRHGTIASFVFAVLLVAALPACHKTKSYDTEVEVTRISTVRKDEAGKPVTSDFEFSYVDCPGSQIETVRGDAKFAQCVARYSVGSKIKLKLDHKWSDEGHWSWEVTKVGECDRTIDPADEASFASIRDCEDWQVNGAKVGFQCTLKAERKLVDKCPWFRRH